MEATISSGEWFAYAASRWRFVLAAVAGAILITFVISELMPRRYTATATLIIDPPPGSDPRAGVAVNPTYLESLRTFERFFTSDTLFQRAAEKFHLADSTDNIASLKKRILKVSKVRETRILEVSVTLPDPATAQQLAQFIAEQSVAASRQEASEMDRQLESQTSALVSEAQRNLARAQQSWNAANADGGVEPLQSELDAALASDTEMQRKAAEAAAESAEWTVRARDGAADSRHYAEVQAQASAARAAEYGKRSGEIERAMAAKRRMLGQISGRRDAALSDLESAQKAYDTAVAKVRDISAQMGTRGEALRIIDPGVAPRKPSFPNVLLNVIAAALLALCFAAMWVTVSLSRSRRRRGPASFAERAA